MGVTSGYRRFAFRAVLFFGVLLLGVLPFGVWRLRRPKAARGDTVRFDGSAFTILVLGGSTALGEPYYPKADLGKIVSYLFEDRIKGHEIRVVNLGGFGKPAAAVAADADAIAHTKPPAGTAVAFLYIGNNEFLKFDVHHDLRHPDRRLFDTPIIPAEQRREVLQEYGRLIDRTITQLQRAGLPVIASTVAVNLKDWDPNRSVLADPAHEAIIASMLRAGDEKADSGNPEEALASYRAILEIEPGFSLAHKKAGDCSRRLGRLDLARTYYQNAVDHDGNPQRETSEQRMILEDVCRRHQVPIVDAAAILENVSQDHLLGYDLMWDNCHPTLEGYVRIAEGFADRMESMLGISRKRLHPGVPAIEQALGIDADFKRDVLKSRGQYCYLCSTITWNPSARLQRAELYLDAAARISPDDADVNCSMAVLAALEGDRDRSIASWRKAYATNAALTRERITNPYVGQILERNGIGGLSSILK